MISQNATDNFHYPFPYKFCANNHGFNCKISVISMIKVVDLGFK